MRQRFKLLTIVLLTFCIVSIGAQSQSYALEKGLKTEKASPADIKGTFTVILYHASSSDDLETIAVLDLEGDGYRIEPYAPDYDYTVKKGVPAEKALSAAEKFVSFHPSFWRTELSKILDKSGNVIGFEVRPLYMPIIYGVSNVLEVDYFPAKDGLVKMKINLIPSVNRLKYPFGGGGAGQ